MKFIIYFTALLSACAASPSRQVASIDFETRAPDAAFEAFMAQLDLEAPNVSLSYKDSGTSVGMKVKIDGKKAGKWVPTNSATNPEAQVVSYYLGRYLQMSEQLVPSAYYTAGPKAVAQFKQMLEAAKEKNAHRKANRESNLAAVLRDPNSLWGVFTAPIDNFETPDLVNASANTINRSHPIAKFIRADGPMPTLAKITLKGLPKKNGARPVETELELSRQFSRIMVLDILTGQWDRFSGGNVEATFDESQSRAILIARDNGGASMKGSSHLKKYFGIVSRFDRRQIDLVRQLKAELARDADLVARSLRMRASPASLSNRINALLGHVADIEAKHGDSATYFP